MDITHLLAQLHVLSAQQATNVHQKLPHQLNVILVTMPLLVQLLVPNVQLDINAQQKLIHL